MSSIVDDVAAQQLHELDKDIRFVVIHPRYLQQHRILDRVFDENRLIYLCFKGSNLSYSQLITQLSDILGTQLGAESFANIRYLVLDECDRAISGELTIFLNEMSGQLGEGQIILLTRNVPDFIYTNPELRQRSCFIPSDRNSMLIDYSLLDTNRILLEVESLGSGRVILNGHPIDNWDGTLPRALFFYLIDRGMSRRNQIFETFWPTLTTREATNVFHVTKRKISEVLGFDLTNYWSGLYHISGDIELRYDVDIFTQLVTESAVATQEDAIPLLARAISLYKNDFLTSIPMSWTQKRREELMLMYGDALALLSRIREQRSEKDEALGLYIRTAMTNPQREDIARKIMSLYAEKGMIDDAEATYHQLSVVLDEHLGVSPSKETQELIGSIRLNPNLSM